MRSTDLFAVFCWRWSSAERVCVVRTCCAVCCHVNVGVRVHRALSTRHKAVTREISRGTRFCANNAHIYTISICYIHWPCTYVSMKRGISTQNFRQIRTVALGAMLDTLTQALISTCGTNVSCGQVIRTFVTAWHSLLILIESHSTVLTFPSVCVAILADRTCLCNTTLTPKRNWFIDWLREILNAFLWCSVFLLQSGRSSLGDQRSHQHFWRQRLWSLSRWDIRHRTAFRPHLDRIPQDSTHILRCLCRSECRWGMPL